MFSLGAFLRCAEHGTNLTGASPVVAIEVVDRKLYNHIDK